MKMIYYWIICIISFLAAFRTFSSTLPSTIIRTIWRPMNKLTTTFSKRSKTVLSMKNTSSFSKLFSPPQWCIWKFFLNILHNPLQNSSNPYSLFAPRWFASLWKANLLRPCIRWFLRSNSILLWNAIYWLKRYLCSSNSMSLLFDEQFV